MGGIDDRLLKRLEQDGRIGKGGGGGDTPGGGGHNGGNPPGGGHLDARVAALEKTSIEMRDKLGGIEVSLARIETTLDGLRTNVFPGLATKADLASEAGTINQSVANFRTELTRMESTLIKWFIATAFLLSGGVGAIAFGLARSIPH